MPVHPDLLAAAASDDPDRVASAVDLVVGWGHGPRGHGGGNPMPGLALIPGGRQLMRQAPPAALGVDLAACDAYGGAPEAAAAVGCPALFLLGALDRMTPAKAGRALAARVGSSQVVVVPDTGHMVMTEAPDAVLGALTPFLALRRG
jgi:pimeloyl-ACP methyl ester carboxylesterase